MLLLLLLIMLFAVTISVGAGLVANWPNIWRRLSDKKANHATWFRKICSTSKIRQSFSFQLDIIAIFRRPFAFCGYIVDLYNLNLYTGLMFIASTIFFAFLISLRLNPIVLGQGPVQELDWDVVDWPDPPPLVTQTTFSGIGGEDITVSFNLDPDCLEGTTATTRNPNDTTLITGGLPVNESLLIFVDYSNTNCTQSFVDITLAFSHAGGVTNVTVPILDIDQDPGPGQGYVDEVVVSATDGTNTYTLSHPQTTFSISNTNFVTANIGASTFTAVDTQPGPIPNSQPDGNAFVTFGQTGIQTITLRYQNPRINSGQGISFGIIFFDVSPAAGADLAISKASIPKPYIPGGAITYTIVVTNFGPSTVNGITVTDNLPPQIQGPSYNPSAGTYTPGNGGWNITLNANDQATLTIVGTVAAGFTGTLQNAATVQSAEGIPDPNTTNNVFTDTNSTLVLVDPALTKQANVNQASPGDRVIFQVTMSNPATSLGNATQVVLTDPLPLQVALDAFSFTSNPPGLVSANSVVTQVVTLPPNHPSGLTETLRYTVILTAPVMAPGTQVDLFITTTVTAVANPGPQTINNTATMNFAEGPPRVGSININVPGQSPAPSGNSGGDDDDDDDDVPPPPPPPAPVPVTVPTTEPQPTPELPVLFLPETGLREGPSEIGLFGGALVTLAAMGIGLIAFRVWVKSNKDD